MTLKIAAKTNLIHCRPTPTVACLCFWPKKGNIVLIQLKLQRKTFKVLCLAVHRTLLMYFCSVLKTSKCQSESSRVVSQNFQSCKKRIYLGLGASFDCALKVLAYSSGKGFADRIWENLKWILAKNLVAFLGQSWSHKLYSWNHSSSIQPTFCDFPQIIFQFISLHILCFRCWKSSPPLSGRK